MSEEFLHLSLPLIEPSLTNPRKSFNEAKLQELAASIKASGVHQPILVRPLPASRVADTSTDPATGKARKTRPTYELVCGERRYRASVLAEVEDIPAMIRDLTDEQVRKIQIVENLQRDDLTELEEAEGYEALMKMDGLNADQIGAEISKSRGYVYGRLKLLDLSQECKQALRDGKIDASRALLIARVPDSKLQKKALEFATKAIWNGDTPSVRALQAWLRDNVMLKLEGAVFKITDVRLVESAGSCKDCPKRTGANPDLFAEVDSADICTDPACYHSKEEAHRAQLLKKAEDKGMHIVQDKEALELLDGRQYRDIPLGYVQLSDKRPDLGQEGDRVQTLGQALGKDAPAPILFIHPRTNETFELVPEAEAEAALLAKGLVKGDKHREQTSENLQAELTQLQVDAKRAADRATRNAVHQATVAAVKATTPAQAKQLLTGDLLRAFILSEMDYSDAAEIAEAIGYEFADGVDEGDALTAHVQRLGDTELLRATALVLLDRDSSPYSSASTPIVEALGKQLTVDYKAAVRKAVAETKAEHAQAIKSIETQIEAAKAPAATAPAARPKEGAGGKKVKQSAGSAEAARRSMMKISAEEATQGIADALQGIEGAASEPGGSVAPPAKPGGEAATAPLGYRGPNGESWSGKGSRPKWLTAYLENGGTLEQIEYRLPTPVAAWPFPLADKVTLPTKAQAAAVRADIGLGIPVGQRIKVLAGKYKGKEGAVLEDSGDDIYRVKVDRVSVAVSFRASQMEVLEGATL